ncbi:ketopantoate reductase family protein [Georgenia subflava]|uniref:2-dehydropantoate 2-reductase n=1 Tax=Georgenia subflava TaxID=1622177 RepID=A0A6N7EEN5_9MICO|nr:2-dehydropantoate 2-reductase [Georgenia subflava]MPV36490.1 2-dehydropantoate 2-reductase [Georgenia subflava]
MIAVVGPGAVGGLLATLLHRAGEDVVVVARPASAARIAVEGLVVRSEMFGELTTRVAVAPAVPAGSAVVLAVKAFGLADVLPDLVRARPAELLSLLNGLGHVRALRAVPGHVIAGSVQVESAREDGVIVQRGAALTVSVPDAAGKSRLAVALRAAGVDVRTRGSEQEVLWHKLAFLAPTALLTAWADRPLGAALRHDPATTEALVAEVAAVATADGRATDPARLASLLHRLPETMRSSLQHDVAAGGPTELEAIGGELLALGERLGVGTPVLARVVSDLRARLSG